MAEQTWSPRSGGLGTFKERNDELFSNPPQEIQIPGQFFPHAGFVDALWITLSAKELISIQTGQRGGNLNLGAVKTKFKFLAPPEILEMHNHDWQEYASLSSRLLEKIVQARNVYDHAKALYTKGSKTAGIMDTLKKVLQGEQGLDGVMRDAQTGASNINLPVPGRKVDTPLAYTNSQRRQLQLTFTLADNNRGRTVVKAVKLMQSFAAAQTTSVVGLKFPHIFKVASEPEGLILMEHAAMTSIQPSWQYPFIDGYPTRCDLTISLTDMSPLFQKTITEGTIINVHPGENDLEPSYEKKKGTFDPRNNYTTRMPTG